MIRQFELVERVKAYDPDGRRGRAQPRLCLRHEGARHADCAPRATPISPIPLEVAGILTAHEARQRLDRHRRCCTTRSRTPAPRSTRSSGCSARRSPAWSTASPSSSRIELQSDHTKQAENFRKLVLAMSEDIRVLLVKLADRLHNMRTLHFIKDADKRRRIARETMEIYAPLAERIGMQRDEGRARGPGLRRAQSRRPRQSIAARLELPARAAAATWSPRIIAELTQTLNERGHRGRGLGPREDALFDLAQDAAQERQLRAALRHHGVPHHRRRRRRTATRRWASLHSAYPVVPGRFKDYISTPKPNGYRSLHTGVIGPERQRIEVQIRTREMHEVAELGVAAHWRYKQGAPQTDGRQYRWLRELLDILEHAAGPEEFLEHTKLEMFQDQVFCFTPKGDLIALPRGATPVDFAYAVHSEVGDTLRRRQDQRPAWCRCAPQLQQRRPGRDRHLARRRRRRRPGSASSSPARRAPASAASSAPSSATSSSPTAASCCSRAGQKEKISLGDKRLEAITEGLHQKSAEDLLAAIGEGALGARVVIEALRREQQAAPPATPAEVEDAKVVQLRRPRPAPAPDGREGLISGLLPGMAINFAGCCHPMPGDAIVGVVRTGRGIAIHRSDCRSLIRKADDPDRWLDLGWNPKAKDAKAVARLQIMTTNQPGSLGSLSTVVGKQGGNITDLRFGSRSPELYEIILDVEVEDRDHLERILASLRATTAVTYVERTLS